MQLQALCDCGDQTGRDKTDLGPLEEPDHLRRGLLGLDRQRLEHTVHAHALLRVEG
jgi:hypothetical protein